jgi:hypothetical protein
MTWNLVDSGDPALPLYRVDNGSIALTFLPTVGGRLLSLTLHGRELLWRNPRYFDDALRAVIPHVNWLRPDGTFSSWTNVGGSKTWPAPQGWGGPDEWAGPPDEVLDFGPWSIASWRQESAQVVTMTSGVDGRSGLQVTREFTVPDHGTEFVLRIVFRNGVDRPITWSIWEVCQVPTHTDGFIEVDVEVPHMVDLGSYVSHLQVVESPDQVLIPVQDVVAKRGFPKALGSIRYVGPAGGVELSSRPFAGVYPDHGSRVELWMQFATPGPLAELDGLHPDARLAELEVLSPLYRLDPGDSAEHVVHWSAFGHM